MRKFFGLSAAAVALTLPLLASAQIKVGVTLSSTGFAASLGIPERNTVALLPKEAAGQKIEWIVLDDATDTAQAVENARKLTSDDKVDVLIGTSVTPGSLAMVDVAAEAQVPMISVAASAKIVEPMDDTCRRSIMPVLTSVRASSSRWKAANGSTSPACKSPEWIDDPRASARAPEPCFAPVFSAGASYSCSGRGRNLRGRSAKNR